MVTRAVHLEVMGSNSEEDFLRAFIKFASRRSFPSIIYSDNAMNFVVTSKTLKDIANSQLVSLALDNYKNRMAFHHSQGSMAMRCVGKDDRHHQKLLEEESW